MAWLTWLTIHIYFLIGFRNRIAVFSEWAWTYFTFTHGARLITGSQVLPGWSEQQGVHMAAQATPLDPASPGFLDHYHGAVASSLETPEKQPIS
jgi:NADH dehydrogenase